MAVHPDHGGFQHLYRIKVGLGSDAEGHPAGDPQVLSF
jgi:hypothetical protein